MNLIYQSMLSALLSSIFFTPVIGATEWQLVWQDEFNAPTIDQSKWNFEVNGFGGGNNELQYYTNRTENARIENGSLIIEARKENYTGSDGFRQYTSARLNSRFKGDWLYGRIEARLKLPNGQGLWPAFWMLPTDYDYGTWAASGEIDVMEFRGDAPTTLITTIHHGGPWPRNIYTGTDHSVPNLTENFHTFAVEWEENEIRWYFEGEQIFHLNNWFSENAPYPAPFDRRFHLLLNVAVGGNFLDDPPANANYFPQRMEVDYVRVYQKNLQTQSPFYNTPISVPGFIQAEDFDIGGQDISYNDNTEENIGGNYRLMESVDIGSSFDTDQTPSIGWFGSGEWLEYTINVEEAGRYELKVRTASGNENAEIQIDFEQNGLPSGSMSKTVNGTGGWGIWATRSVGEITLPSGEQVLRLTIPNQDANINWIELIKLANPMTEDLWQLY